MSDLPKVKNYDVKVRIKNQDLPKARISDKTINFDFPKVNSASIFLDLQTFRKGEKQRELINCCTVTRFIYSIYHLTK